MINVSALTRAELAALVVQTLAAAGIDVVLVGGSCVCVYTNERFGSFDLDFIDMPYARKKDISAALAIGHEQITADRVEELNTSMGKVRLLSPTLKAPTSLMPSGLL